MNWIILSTGAIGLIFAGALFERYRALGGNHLFAWAIGALFYGLAALAEGALSLGFNEPALKIWYLGGAMLAAPWLGQGTIYLLVRKRMVAPVLGAFLLLISLFSVQLIAAAPIDLSAGFDVNLNVSDQYREWWDHCTDDCAQYLRHLGLRGRSDLFCLSLLAKTHFDASGGGQCFDRSGGLAASQRRRFCIGGCDQLASSQFIPGSDTALRRLYYCDAR